MLTQVIRGVTHLETINFVLETCCQCDIPFFIPEYMKKRLLVTPTETFYCPNGHSLHYNSKTEVHKLQEELQKIKESSKKERIQLQDELTKALLEQDKLNQELLKTKGLDNISKYEGKTYKNK